MTARGPGWLPLLALGAAQFLVVLDTSVSSLGTAFVRDFGRVSQAPRRPRRDGFVR